MKSHRKELWFDVPGRRGFVNITRQVEAALRESGVQEGLVLVNAMHITASVFINDDEPGLHHDYEKWLEQLAPHAPTTQYRHNDTGEDNADAHLKRQIMGREVVVAITDGRARLRPLGADLLRRVRRPPEEAGAGQDHRRVSAAGAGRGSLATPWLSFDTAKLRFAVFSRRWRGVRHGVASEPRPASAGGVKESDGARTQTHGVGRGPHAARSERRAAPLRHGEAKLRRCRS